MSRSSRELVKRQILATSPYRPVNLTQLVKAGGVCLPRRDKRYERLHRNR